MPRRAALLVALLVVASLATAGPAMANVTFASGPPTVTSSAVSVQHVRYTVTFTVGATLSGATPGTSITIQGPTGTVMPTVATIHDNTAGTTFSRSATQVNSNTGLRINLCCSDVINAGDNVTVTIDDVTNGSVASAQTLDVFTSAEPTPVTSPTYTLTNQLPVTNVTAPSMSSNAAGAQHVRYSFSFKTSVTNGGLVGPGTITVTAPTGTALPLVGTITVNGTTTFSRSGTHPVGTNTLRLSLCCTDAIPAGADVTVTLDDVTNPSAAVNHTIDVSTSSNPSPVTSPSYTVQAANNVTVVSAPTLSSNAGGVPHVRYLFSFKAGLGNGGLVAPGTITITAPTGTVLPLVGTITVNGTTTFSRSGTHPVGSNTLRLSLCCSDSVPAGADVTIRLDDVTNPAAAGGLVLNVSTSSSPTPVQGQPYALTAAEQITGVSGVSLTSAAGGVEHVRYSFGFSASGSTGGLVAPGTIKIDAPPGTVLPTFGTIHDTTSGASFSRSGVRSNSNATLTLSLCCTDAINPGDAVTITLDDVTNAATGGPYTFNLSTSSNPSPVATGAYSLSAPQQVTDVSAVTTSTDTHGVLSDVFSFKTSVPTGGLVAPGTITVTGPAGTVMPTVARIDDETAGVGFTRSGVRSNSNATLTVSLCCTDAIGAGDKVTISLPEIVNPASGAGPFAVFTSSDTGSVTTPPFTGPPPPPPPPTKPPPVLGKKATAAVEKGIVRVKVPGGKFVPLNDVKSIPVGSILDATKGQVALTFATSSVPGTKTQTGSFSQGQFQMQQSKKSPLTTMSMVGGGLKSCTERLPKGGAAKPQADAARKHRRTLFSHVKGRFRTRGRNSTATVRGTTWQMTDTCKGTKTSVTKGSVLVRDLSLRKNKLVKAGHSYFARAPKGKKKRH